MSWTKDDVRDEMDEQEDGEEEVLWIDMSPNPAVEPQNRPRAARLDPLVYKVEEIAQLLAISPRAAYNLCNTTKDFRVVRIDTSIRVNRQSFDAWFAAF